MKTIFKIQKTAVTAKPILNYILTLKKGDRVDKGMDINARIGAVIVSDDLQGLDMTNHKDRASAGRKIETWTRNYAKTKHTRKRGRKSSARHREHYTISAEAGEDHKDFEVRLKKALPELCAELNINTFVCVLHVDCKHPHAHIICDAFAPAIGKGERRHICKTKLKMLNENEWTKHFDSPSLGGVANDISDRSKTVKTELLNGWSKKKLELAAFLYHKGVKDLESFGKVKLGNKVTRRYKRKNGELYSRPSIKCNGVSLSYSHFAKNLPALLENKNFKAEIEKLNTPSTHINTSVHRLNQGLKAYTVAMNHNALDKDFHKNSAREFIERWEQHEDNVENHIDSEVKQSVFDTWNGFLSRVRDFAEGVGQKSSARLSEKKKDHYIKGMNLFKTGTSGGGLAKVKEKNIQSIDKG